MTGRLLDAIANPRVHILGHPATRLIGTRDPVSFDFARVVPAAAEAGVALEINGSPLRMDLTDTLARTAQEAGVLFAINSDAHSAAQLEYMRYGVSQARLHRGEERDQHLADRKAARWLNSHSSIR